MTLYSIIGLKKKSFDRLIIIYYNEAHVPILHVSREPPLSWRQSDDSESAIHPVKKVSFSKKIM